MLAWTGDSQPKRESLPLNHERLPRFLGGMFWRPKSECGKRQEVLSCQLLFATPVAPLISLYQPPPSGSNTLPSLPPTRVLGPLHPVARTLGACMEWEQIQVSFLKSNKVVFYTMWFFSSILPNFHPQRREVKGGSPRERKEPGA